MSTADVRPEAPPREHSPVSDAALWTSVLGPPLVFLLNLEINYAMVTWACTSGNGWALHVVHLVSLLAALGAGLMGRALWNRLSGAWPDSLPGSPARARFMAALGALGGVLFALVILAQWVTAMVLGPCLRA